MRRYLVSTLTAICVGASALALTSPALAEELTIRWGTSPGYKPFIFKKADGSLTGFDYEIGDALCEEMNAKCSWVEQAWDGIIPGLKAKNYDAILASMSVTSDRQKIIDFSRTYQNAPSRFVAKDGADFDDTGDLAGKIIGVQRGTTHHDLIKAKFPKAEIKPYPSQDEVWLDLTADRIDGTFTSSLVAAGWLAGDDAKGYGVTGADFFDTDILGSGAAIAVRKGEDELREKLSAAIDAIRANGKYQIINARYFDFDIFGSE